MKSFAKIHYFFQIVKTAIKKIGTATIQSQKQAVKKRAFPAFFQHEFAKFSINTQIKKKQKRKIKFCQIKNKPYLCNLSE